jgi:hypothetical protein
MSEQEKTAPGIAGRGAGMESRAATSTPIVSYFAEICQAPKWSI